MGSPEKPIDVEMGDMSDETNKLNPQVKVEDANEKSEKEEERFTGLKKEQLLEIANQPKWRTARWILFILFWVGWVGMLVGAIIIVVKAPRCKKEPTPAWYQDTVVYQADVNKFAGNLAGMAEHVKYVKDLNMKTITVCHGYMSEDPKKVVMNDEEGFRNLVEVVHDSKMKVTVDIPIDSLSTSSSLFKSSAACKENRYPCYMFQWQENVTALEDSKSTWILHPGRGEYYMASAADNTMAYINYAVPEASAYLEALVKQWINYGTDGFQFRDMGKVSGIDVTEIVKNAVNESFAGEDDTRVVGLYYISSATISDQVELFGAKSNETDDAPVVINTELSGNLQENGTGKQLRNIIGQWRTEIWPKIGGFAVNTIELPPLASRLTRNRVAALTLLSLTLPGVPIIKSGDEAALLNDTFSWVKDEKEKYMLEDTDKAMEEMVREMADLRVSEFRSHQSLRWDNEDAKFQFLDTNSDDVLAFSRKWDTKPTVIVVSNLSINNRTVSITSPNTEQNKATVLVSSDTSVVEKAEYNLEEFFIPSDQTLFLVLK